MITPHLVQVGTGAYAPTAALWAPFLQKACDTYGITSPQAVCAFLANVGAESGCLTMFVENLNYSAHGLADTWPSRFSITPTPPHTPNALAVSLARKPQAIANNVYANRLGNGDVASNDGWNYRGQGPIQLTGKGPIQACLVALGLDPVADVGKLQEPEIGSMSAARFFANAGCIQAAEANDFAKVVKLVNGQPPCAANSGMLRINRYNNALAAIKESAG